MDRRHLAVFVVVLAGCNGVTLPGGGANAPTATLTPVPLSPADSTATDVPGDLPPGVFPDGTVDVERLKRAHAAALANRSYTWTFREHRTRTHPRHQSTYRSVRRFAVADGRLLGIIQEGERPADRIFVADGTGYRRTGADGPVERIADPVRADAFLITDRMLELFLANRTFRIDVVERDGRRLYRLFAAPTDDRIVLGERTTTVVWNLRVTAYVTSDGFVRTLSVEYSRRSVSWREHVHLRFDYSAVGSTTVTRPEWATNATAPPSETGTVVTNRTGDRPEKSATNRLDSPSRTGGATQTSASGRPNVMATPTSMTRNPTPTSREV
ncbi:MAG: hypothetical protein ABEJ85_01535 [Haloarculaceae archaeon]